VGAAGRRKPASGPYRWHCKAKDRENSLHSIAGEKQGNKHRLPLRFPGRDRTAGPHPTRSACRAGNGYRSRRPGRIRLRRRGLRFGQDLSQTPAGVRWVPGGRLSHGSPGRVLWRVQGGVLSVCFRQLFAKCCLEC
jgi:hypothetical protein